MASSTNKYKNVTVFDENIEIGGITAITNTTAVIDAATLKSNTLTDTFTVGTDITTSTYLYTEEKISTIPITANISTGINYFTYSYTSESYADLKNYYGGVFSAEIYNGGVSDLFFGGATYSKYQLTDGLSHTINDYWGYYNSVRGIQGGSSTATLNSMIGIFNDMDVSVGVAGGTLNLTELYGIKNEMNEDADITHNITNAYGLWLGGTLNRADTLYGIYEDLGNNYFANNITTAGILQFTDDATEIWKDGSSNLTFKDAVTGTKTLAELVSTEGIMQVAKAQVLYTNTSQTTIVTLPANAVVWNIGLEVATLFDDSGTDLLDIGITGEVDRYFDDLNISATYFEQSTGGSDNTYLQSPVTDKITGSTNITFQYTGQNANASQGEAYVYIHYTLH